MRVFVNGRESGALTHDQWREASVFLLNRWASGRVMNLAEAGRAKFRLALGLGAFFLIGSWIMALVFAILGSRDGFLGMFAAGCLAGIVIYPIALLWLPFLRRDLAERRRGVPEPGIQVKVDEAGLAIGGRAAAWRDLFLDAVYLRTDVDGLHSLDRLTLSGAFEGASLDLNLIENGRDILGHTFLRLCPEPPSGKS